MPDGESRAPGAAARFGQGFLSDTWYLTGLSGELRAGRLRHVDLLGEPILLGRGRQGQVFALRDVCPHRAAPLSAGRLYPEPDGTETVACPYHGWRFGADGACKAIPSLTADQAMDIGRIQVRRYPVVESQGLIFVWMGAVTEEPDHPPPTFPGVVGGPPKLVDRMVFDAHIDQAVVGLMDPAHGPYVHRQWWWRTAGSEHDKEKRFEPREAGFAMVRHSPSRNSRAYAILGGRPETEITFRLPGLRWEHVVVGRRQVLSLTALTPIDESRTEVTQLVWSDHPAFILLKPVIGAMARAFLRQDADMVRLQNAGLKHDPALLWIDDADRQAKWYQSLKREWIASRHEERPFVNPVKPATLRWRS
jgi:phenylpropionate dioxygenase-like ring-hydroxylating dioxygenase large terminal subunit